MGDHADIFHRLKAERRISRRVLARRSAAIGLALVGSAAIPPLRPAPAQVATPDTSSPATPGTSEAVATVTEVTHHTAFVNGVALHYVTAGQGDPVILLHGWPQSWYQWRRVIPLLAERYTVIAPDLRGYADSGKPDGPYDTRTMAEDVYQLAQQLGLGSVFLAGHDVGAAVAYAYAAAHRDDVRRLAYIDEPLPGFSYEGVAAFSPETSLGGGFWWASFHMVPDLPDALIAGREALYLSWFYDNLSYDKSAIAQEDLAEYVRAYSVAGAMRASRGFYRDVFVSAEQNRETAQTKLTIPVLAIGAAPFGLGPITEQDMRAVASDVRGMVIEPSGHFVAEERPNELAAALLDFFADQSSSPTGAARTAGLPWESRRPGPGW